MGVTISYRGSLADIGRVEDFEDRVLDLALEIGGQARVWRSVDDDDPRRVVRGLMLDLYPGQETTSLLISPEGWLLNLFEIEDAEQGRLAGPPWCFVIPGAASEARAAASGHRRTPGARRRNRRRAAVRHARRGAHRPARRAVAVGSRPRDARSGGGRRGRTVAREPAGRDPRPGRRRIGRSTPNWPASSKLASPSDPTLPPRCTASIAGNRVIHGRWPHHS